jgi:predicted nucleic acid-binding protein
VAVILLDTSVLIALRKSNDSHHQAAVAALQGFQGEIAISSITLTEALIAPLKVAGAKGKAVALKVTEAVDQIFDFTTEIAIDAASIRVKTGLTLADSMIAATASVHAAQLWTCDAKLAKAAPGSVLIT